MGGPEKLQWDTFLSQEDVQPTAGGLNKKALFHSASPSAPFSSYQDVSCLQSQFSIESDSDMTESTGLIQEYDVFDPERPRPKIETTVEELKQQFIKHPKAKGFVVDGFPRDIGQAFLCEEQ
ncbi:hypothetical protein Chor_004343, partial [Crotalus horridus]